MVTIKQQIQWELGPEINATRERNCGLHIRADGSPVEMPTIDPNSWGRRNFSLYIEGSYGYDGEATYEANKKYVLRYQGNPRKMRMFAIRNCTELVAFEYGCTYTYASKCVVAVADKEILASYTKLLINDAIDQFN